MALNKKKLMGLLALLLDDEEEEEKPSPVPSGLIPSFLGKGIENPGNVPIGPYRPSDNPREGIVPIGPYRAQPNTGNPRDSMVPLINWQGSQEGWNNFLENWRRGGAAPQSPVAPGADRHPPMPPQNNFGMIPDFGMQNPFLGIDKSSPMPIPEGIEPYQPMGVDPSTLNELERRDYMQGLMGDRYTNVYGTPEIHGPGMRVAEPVGSDYAKRQDKDWGEGLFEASTRYRGQAPFLDDPQVKLEIFNAARAGGANPQSPTWHDDALERVVEKYGLATVQRVINEESAAARFHLEGDNAPWEVLDSSMRELKRISDGREGVDNGEGVANEDRGNPFLTAQGVVDPATGQRRVSTPVGQPIPQPNEEVGFMDREISDHGQKMRNVMDAYYGGADFGYETEWAEGLGVAQKDIDNFMAALNSGDIDAAMQSPTDFMLEEFERKWGWPLNVNSSSYRGNNG
tara:strand:+ start:837 stop:2207 length:1371 start_codon:yes stop_codon:yes gene_type:complete